MNICQNVDSDRTTTMKQIISHSSVGPVEWHTEPLQEIAPLGSGTMQTRMSATRRWIIVIYDEK